MGIFRLSIVGAEDSPYTIPHSLISLSPLDIIFPPIVADVNETSLAESVMTIGMDGEAVVVKCPFLIGEKEEYLFLNMYRR